MSELPGEGKRGEKRIYNVNQLDADKLGAKVGGGKKKQKQSQRQWGPVNLQTVLFPQWKRFESVTLSVWPNGAVPGIKPPTDRRTTPERP